MRFQQYLTEAKVTVSPLLKSVIGKRWENMTKEQSEDLLTVLSKVSDGETKITLAPAMAGKMKGNNRVTVTRKDNVYETVVTATKEALVQSGWKVVKSMVGDSQTWVIYFTE